MQPSFTPQFGFEPDSRAQVLGAEPIKLQTGAAPPKQYDAGWHSEPLVQVYSDCVPRSSVKAMRRRIILQRTPERRFELGPPEIPASRWAYWHWLESIGRLGDTSMGTQPYAFVDLMNKRGWCAEQYMPYLVDDAPPGVDVDSAPPIAAYQHAHDQKGKLKAHFVSNTGFQFRAGLAQNLTGLVALALDQPFVDNTGSGIPDDPSFVWNFNPNLPIVGWHMMEAESYNEFGVLCLCTWGIGFANRGYVRVGYETLANRHFAMDSLLLDWVPDLSEAYS